MSTPTVATVTAPELFVLALGIHPVDEHATDSPEDTHCVLCAAPIAAGAPAYPFTPPATWVDWANHAYPDGQWLCPSCRYVTTHRECMDATYGKSVASAQGLFGIASNAAFAHFSLNPPPPPFAAWFGTTKKSHMIWRAPVSMSHEYMLLRYGDTVLSIRAPVLRQIYEACAHIKASHPDFGLRGRIGKPGFGNVYALPEDSADVREAIENLSPGELFALGAALKTDGGIPPVRYKEVAQ